MHSSSRVIAKQLITGEVYHIYNRGVEKRDIFMDDRDYIRFIHDLYEFNNTAAAKQYSRTSGHHVGSSTSNMMGLPGGGERERFVDILCWCLMPNHFHLMVRQRLENGISQFMQKIGTGYTHAFNARYNRSGVLFQGKFKWKHVSNNAQFLHLPFYIHANPIDLIEYGWRDTGVADLKGIMRFLESYRWSSFRDYIGVKNFSSLLDDQKIIWGGKTSPEYRTSVQEWLATRDFSSMTDISID